LVRQADASASGYWNTSSSGTSNARDLERHLERGGVPTLLDGDDGLARHADAIREIFCPT
jgi:hypothetical protein